MQEAGVSYVGLNFLGPPRDIGAWFQSINDPNERMAEFWAEFCMNIDIFQMYPVTDKEHFHFVGNDPTAFITSTDVFVSVPLPATVYLFAGGLLGMGARLRWRREE